MQRIILQEGMFFLQKRNPFLRDLSWKVTLFLRSYYTLHKYLQYYLLFEENISLENAFRDEIILTIETRLLHKMRKLYLFYYPGV